MSKKEKWFLGLLSFALLFTGFAQMPIFKRYYLADIPGFVWTADYYLNHRLHYLLAFILLFYLFYKVVTFFSSFQLKNLTFLGWLKVFLWGGIVFTGMLRVLKNFPQVVFDYKTVMYVDWIHLGLPFLLFIFFILGKVAGISYLRK